MKNIIKLTIGFILINILMGCNGEDLNNNSIPRPPINKSSYIQGFFELNNIHISPIRGIQVNEYDKIVDFSQTSFEKETIYGLTDGIGLSINIIDFKNGLIYGSDRYRNIVKEIGDTCFNTTANYGYTISTHAGVVSVSDTIQAVIITCDKQFDRDHPVGSNLNDLFTIYYEDPYNFIKNEYKEMNITNHYKVKDLPGEKEYPLYVVQNNLNDINFEEHLYIGATWYLTLDKQPEKTDEYLFSISISSNNGKVITGIATNKIKIKCN